MNLQNLFMKKQKIKKKFIFLGEEDSINIELIINSFDFLKNKVHYILLCNKEDIIKNNYFKNKNIKINEILNPINFMNYKKNMLNIFNIENISRMKYLNLLNQIKIANNLSNITKYDLITMPINKAIFKRKIDFIGMTEYLGSINKKSTLMLMHGDYFSIIPMTTHINVKNIHKYINTKIINNFLHKINKNLRNKYYGFKFKKIKFLCFNPHCGEEGTLGKEDLLIKKIINKNSKISGPYPADSAFNKIDNKTLYISTYHDQALIPFKILNKQSMNITLGLNYIRLSPAHGTGKEIKNKSLSDNSSYLKCLLY